MIGSLFETLLRQDWTGAYIPQGAESWSASEDGLTWTFKLNPKSVWTDGKPVTAKDWEYSFKRITDPATGATYGNYLELAHVKNAAAIVKGEKPVSELGVRAVDDLTFEITLDEPTPWLLRMLTLANLAPLREDVIAKHGVAWTRPENIVSNGAYVITQNAFEDKIVIEKSPTYWDKDNVTITKVNWTFIKDPNASYLGYQTGAYDTATIPPALKQAAIEKFPNDLVTTESQSIYYTYLNVKEVPDIRVRKAIALLIDRKTLTEKIVKNNKATTTMVPDNIDGAQYVTQREWFNTPMAERRKQAVELLKEAGYSKGNPFKLKYTTNTSDIKQTSIAMRDWLEKGSQGAIEIVPDVREIKGWQDALNTNTFMMIGGGWGADYDYITTFLDLGRCGDVLNHAGYCSAEADALMKKATAEKDADARAKIYAEAEKLYMAGYAAVPMWQSTATILKRPTLKGYNRLLSNRYIADYYLVTEDSIKAADAYEAEQIKKAAASSK